MYNTTMNDYLPLSAVNLSKEELLRMNPAVLSFVGDAVQTLYVRAELAALEAKKTHALHKMAAGKINAASQAGAAHNILDMLDEEETEIFKRCRNCKTHSSAKNAAITDYRVASGLEGLIGYLYMSGRHERLHKLLIEAYKQQEKATKT